MSSCHPAEVEAAIAALDTVRSRWLHVDGVTAVDVGFKVSGGAMSDTLALRVHVARKRPAAELAPSEVFNVSGEGRTIGGFPVDVLEARYGPSTRPLDVRVPVGAALGPPLRAFVDRRGRTRPVRPGISVGNPRISAGTLGAVVFQRITGQPMLLSNFHVLAGARAAAAGEAVLQPGSVDGGRDPEDRVATLRWMRLDASMDAAVADLDGVEHDLHAVGVGDITGATAPTLGMLVVKSGRTTAVTEGVVDGVSLTVAIAYGGDVGTVTLTDQVHIVPRSPWPTVDSEVSMGGDSGSVWLEESTRRAVALHFGGELDPAPASEHALATPIDRVVAEFGISFLPVPFRLPSASLCERFPRLCALVQGPVVPPVPVPDPGPLVDLGRALPRIGATVPQARRDADGCGCGQGQGPGAARPEGTWDEHARAELLQLLSELDR